MVFLSSILRTKFGVPVCSSWATLHPLRALARWEKPLGSKRTGQVSTASSSTGTRIHAAQKRMESNKHLNRIDRKNLIAQRESDQRVPRDYRYILLTLDLIGDGRHHDRPAQIRLPELLARLRVERVEIPFAPAGEENIGRRRQHPGIGHVELRETPDALA